MGDNEKEKKKKTKRRNSRPKSETSTRLKVKKDNKGIKRAVDDVLTDGGVETGMTLSPSSSSGEKRIRKVENSNSSEVSSVNATNAVSKSKNNHEFSEEIKEKPENDTTLISSMSNQAIQDHLGSLKSCPNATSRRTSQICLPFLKKLLNDPCSWVFKDPVDPIELGLPDYLDVIKTPMDLTLIGKKLESGDYNEIETFGQEIRLVFDNAIVYNGECSDVGAMAKKLLNMFDKAFSEIGKEQNSQEKKETCSLCGNGRILFEPHILDCNGSCATQRICRNGAYYTDKNKVNNWCESCYELLKDDEGIMFDDGCKIQKNDLQAFKNDASPNEGWVQCDDCLSWVHQICALFNSRKNKTAASYSCAKCLLKKRNKVSRELLPSKCAEDLPHCDMSKEIEVGVLKTLEKAYEESARKDKCNILDVKKATGLSIRLVSNTDKMHTVREGMYAYLGKKGYPSEFPVRTKCILMFQKIHGVDVLLFVMYVHEYDQVCPSPNTRRVYISYLDSVKYFEPSCYRTLAYHSILVEYLRYVKKRGFLNAHIWCCPPSNGDNYVFNCRPPQQLTPKDCVLYNWYVKMLERAKSEKIVVKVKTLYEEYFINKGIDVLCEKVPDPMCLPYFEGDYIQGEIENIIKEINDEEVTKQKEKCIDSISPTEPKCKMGNKIGTRSNPGALVNQQRDKVMLRLGHALSPMKKNFH